MVNGGKIDIGAVAPQVHQRISPLSFIALRRYCQETSGVSYRHLMKAITVGFMAVNGVKWVFMISTTIMIVVWEEPHNTQDLWRLELALKNALEETINEYELSPRFNVN